LKQLLHNGLLIPKYEALGFEISVNGERRRLTPAQEEMAVAWVKKLSTDYVKDRVFKKNFFNDFCNALDINPSTAPSAILFTEIQTHFNNLKIDKLSLTKGEKKLLAKTRKEKREFGKEKFGYAIVDNTRVEIANFTAEPSSIFMGRGKHPLRGKWKKGPQVTDITLNLSPESPRPQGNWNHCEWQPNSMWIAKWSDALQGKIKYVWLSDSSFLKQEREKEKFDDAIRLKKHIRKVRNHIKANLVVEDPLRRKIATVCYMIDTLKFRVGDEKDQDEADTVGATTLRPEHVSYGLNDTVIFDFLGKDSIHWHLEAQLSSQVIQNIKEFSSTAKSAIFKGVRSDNVSSFLDEVMPGLSAKVFRTYHATQIVAGSLRTAKITPQDPEFLKKHVAKMANLEAAKACNHKKQISKSWRASLTKMKTRLKKLRSQKRQIRARKTRKKETKIRRLQKIDERINKLRLQIKLKEATKEYNLNTSLKSYIDPRTYYYWSESIEYDWHQIYSKSLQRKFHWVENT
jgi:DNA topoisomerase-1